MGHFNLKRIDPEREREESLYVYDFRLAFSVWSKVVPFSTAISSGLLETGSGNAA